jgi:hypothetical protein
MGRGYAVANAAEGSVRQGIAALYINALDRLLMSASSQKPVVESKNHFETCYRR